MQWTRAVNCTEFNAYQRYFQYKRNCSKHLIAFRRDSNGLYVNINYFRAIVDAENRRLLEAQKLYYEVKKSSISDLALCRQLAKQSNKKEQYYYRFLMFKLFSLKRDNLTPVVSLVLPDFLTNIKIYLGV